MARQKKKRNKKYTGEDAAVTKKTVTRVAAPERSPLSEWWVDHKTGIVARATFLGIVLVIAGIIYVVVHFIF